MSNTMNADQFPESKEELKRLKGRARKYLDYALDKNKGKRSSKVLSLAIMISIERCKAVDEFQRRHKYRTMSRWDHFMAIFDSRRIFK
ncbi:MAG: hypothetical protein WC747_04440 [Candidatus Babeliales bacterium]|jgi:hypothetical protein